MSLHDNDVNGRDTRLNVHKLSVCLIIYAKIVSITKNAVQHGVKMKMSPTQNPTILKCIAMDRTKRREGAKNRSSLDVS